MKTIKLPVKEQPMPLPLGSVGCKKRGCIITLLPQMNKAA